MILEINEGWTWSAWSYCTTLMNAFCFWYEKCKLDGAGAISRLYSAFSALAARLDYYREHSPLRRVPAKIPKRHSTSHRKLRPLTARCGHQASVVNPETRPARYRCEPPEPPFGRPARPARYCRTLACLLHNRVTPFCQRTHRGVLCWQSTQLCGEDWQKRANIATCRTVTDRNE